MKKLSFYNGTEHPLYFYRSDTENYIKCRYSDEWILKNTAIEPIFSLPQAISLNAHSSEAGSTDEYGIRIFLPGVISLDVLPDYERYDCIVVSRRYAEAVIRNWQSVPPDFSDRLFITDRKVKDMGHKLLGCCGIRKVLWPLSVEHYINAFATGHIPSLAAARVCLEYYSAQISNGLYPELWNKVCQLDSYIISEEARRESPRQTVFYA